MRGVRNLGEIQGSNFSSIAGFGFSAFEDNNFVAFESESSISSVVLSDESGALAVHGVGANPSFSKIWKNLGVFPINFLFKF